MKIVAKVLTGLMLAICVAGFGSTAKAAPQSTAAETISGADTLGVMFIETGSLERIARASFNDSGRQILESWSAQAGFASLPVEKRERVREYLTAVYPQEATDDVVANAPDVLRGFGSRMEGLLTASQRIETAAFLRSPDGRSWFRNLAAAGASSYTPSDSEARALAAFSATPAGAIFDSEQMSNLIEDASGQIILARAPVIRHRLLSRVCEILGEDCPPGLVPQQ